MIKSFAVACAVILLPATSHAQNELEKNLATAQAAYAADSMNADAITWLGRRLAYLGRYREAIETFSKGIQRHPNDARFYRHRGHRYITVREFDNAIRDLERAAKLVDGKPDEVEPDGAPNKYNIPVSTLHTNIWYHLALAHYLKHDFERALPAWRKAVEASTNDDMLVASSDWLYMTLRRLGRNQDAVKVLAPIKKEMRILENDAYHRRLLMYKGEIAPDELLTAGEDPVQIATYGYGVGNWYLYNGQRNKALEIFRKILEGQNKAAFGFIAAERELAPRVAPAISGENWIQQSARRYRQTHEAEILADFAKLLALPNVAADSPNVRANARYIADALNALGVKSEVWQRPGASPLVYGELRVPGARRTLGLYAHYDGQPVNPKEWKATAPWQPALYSHALEAGGKPIAFPKPGEKVDPEWRIYARSAGDDKAPIAALFAVLRARVPTTSNIKFLFEGEEEAGSENLRAYLDEHRAQLADVNAWLFFDGPVHASGRPQIVFGVRGLAGLEVTVYGAVRPLHSGHYGNWAPNPALMVAELLAAMKDESGRVVIDGFYESVAPIEAEEHAALAALPDYDTTLKRELGLARTDGNAKSLPEALLQPSLNIRGFTSANTGASAANIIPSTATASIDVRLVKGNDPEKMVDLVERFIRKQGYHIVRADPDVKTRLAYPKIAKVTREGGYPASRASMREPVLQQVVAAARSVAGDQLVLLPTMGGSLPLYLFTDVLGKPVIVMPIANYDDNQHAADENLRIGNLWYGIDLLAAVLTMQH